MQIGTVTRPLAAAVLLAAAASAHAFDYLRLDLGLSTSTGANIRDRDFAADRMICGDAACATPGSISDVGNSPFIDFGVGWNLQQNFRADVVAYFRGWYKLDDTMPDGKHFKADVSSWSLMLNVYYDYPLAPYTWKPYVGVGVGVAANKVHGFNVSGSGGPSGTESGMAYAAMLGVLIPIPGNRRLDLGYRYADLGKIGTNSGTVGSQTYQGFEGKLKAHELFVGVLF